MREWLPISARIDCAQRAPLDAPDEQVQGVTTVVGKRQFSFAVREQAAPRHTSHPNYK
jgi:hypothetical protein